MCGHMPIIACDSVENFLRVSESTGYIATFRRQVEKNVLKASRPNQSDFSTESPFFIHESTFTLGKVIFSEEHVDECI